jgi:hypothetical protein
MWEGKLCAGDVGGILGLYQPFREATPREKCAEGSTCAGWVVPHIWKSTECLPAAPVGTPALLAHRCALVPWAA